mgnify:CR=1 FL=1
MAKKTDKVADRIKTLDTLLPDVKNMNKDAQRAIFSEHYRGSIKQSPETRKLINRGNYKEASVEFLNNDQYKNAEKLGIRGMKHDNAPTRNKAVSGFLQRGIHPF